ncbi:MAG TPA: sigma 54-interacting transcriptional regulator [Myxococcaceae bacterium]|nr:sigma 54-interacting transcriptional regulator [Myxococcaceae bacterium]
MQQLVKEIGKVAAAPRATVLVTGESGTGKELVARGAAATLPISFTSCCITGV